MLLYIKLFLLFFFKLIEFFLSFLSFLFFVVFFLSFHVAFPLNSSYFSFLNFIEFFLSFLSFLCFFMGFERTSDGRREISILIFFSNDHSQLLHQGHQAIPHCRFCNFWHFGFLPFLHSIIYGISAFCNF